jgi:hypothetical protein
MKLDIVVYLNSAIKIVKRNRTKRLKLIHRVFIFKQDIYNKEGLKLN